MIESRAQTRLIASGISCRRGGRLLYDRLSFSLADGDVLLLTGPNGAGKTSLLRQVAGLLVLDTGTIALEGTEPGEATHYIGHASAVKDALTVYENLRFWTAVYGHGRAPLQEALTRLRLQALAHLPARVLSAGQKRRLSLAKLLLIPRKLWLLDEPDTALDQEGRETLQAMIAAHRERGGMAMIASHGTLAVSDARQLSLGLHAKAHAA